MRHEIKPLGYLRYGDDFIMFMQSAEQACEAQKVASKWLFDALRLSIHSKNNIVVKASRGLKFLGHQIYPLSGVTVDRTMARRLPLKIDRQNAGGYKAMHLTRKQSKQFSWLLRDNV